MQQLIDLKYIKIGQHFLSTDGNVYVITSIYKHKHVFNENYYVHIEPLDKTLRTYVFDNKCFDCSVDWFRCLLFKPVSVKKAARYKSKKQIQLECNIEVEK